MNKMFKIGFHTDKTPNASIPLLRNANFTTSGFIVRNVELRQYIKSTDPRLGEYLFITVLIETDKGSIEIKYDEGYKGKKALKDRAYFLSHYVGYNSLIVRAVMELQDLLA